MLQLAFAEQHVKKVNDLWFMIKIHKAGFKNA